MTRVSAEAGYGLRGQAAGRERGDSRLVRAASPARPRGHEQRDSFALSTPGPAVPTASAQLTAALAGWMSAAQQAETPGHSSATSRAELLMDAHGSVAEEIARLSHAIENNNFATGRGLKSYAPGLGTKFVEGLARLRSGDGWLDVGAGAGVALAERQELGGPQLRLAGITAGKLPEYSKLAPLAEPGASGPVRGAGLVMWPHTRAEELDPARHGLYQLVSDYYASATYAPRLDLVIAGMLRVTAPGGQLSTALPGPGYAGSGGRFFFAHLVSARGEPVPLEAWLSRIRGAEIESLSMTREEDQHFAITLRRLDQPLVVPPLEVVAYQGRIPPVRRWRMG